ncbi:hypothetical protein RGQ29_027970 [Quercus rubra]|uniref:F-box domain-containing protein n=1 Tax=Quercus rubra TaxID=3512 RepID=A0AAN7EQL9_QUERU|nr:hypothetical protein RGQ29_027970 [Quercus rubra]
MSDHIPQEVIVKILSQLPVKSLIRLRCVSRSWFSLISCHDFITLHHIRALSNAQNPPYLLFRHYDQKIGKDCVTLLSSDNPFPPNLKEEYFTCPSSFIEMHCPHKSFIKRFFIVATEDDIAPLLWNPSIHKAIFLPTPEFPFSYMPMQYYGFGYDPTTDDYILVRVLYLEEEEGDDLKNDQLMVQIYTLGTGTWRNITNPGPGSLSAFPENHLSVFVNGAVHWIASIEDDYIIYVILSFDIRDNTFHEVALPESLDDVNKLNIKVAVHDGSLALFKSALTCCSVWVIKEYGVAESWTSYMILMLG